MVSTLRLYLLRATYLLVSLFLLTQIWPQVIRHSGEPAIMSNVARCTMAAMAPLMLLGLRYPLKMLPIMLFEFFWKTIWVAAFGLPLWLGHNVTPEIAETIKACGMGVVLCPIVIPWGYVWTNYVKPQGDRWHGAASPSPT
jgi:hypothetical protein